MSFDFIFHSKTKPRVCVFGRQEGDTLKVQAARFSEKDEQSGRRTYDKKKGVTICIGRLTQVDKEGRLKKGPLFTTHISQEECVQNKNGDYVLSAANWIAIAEPLAKRIAEDIHYKQQFVGELVVPQL